MAIVLLSAGAYTVIVPPQYKATTIIRYSALATSMFDGAVGYPGVDLDLDVESVTSNPVIQAAAGSLNESPSVVQAAASTQLVEGKRTNRLDLSATGRTPAEAQRRADAIATAYTAYLQSQVDAGIARVKTQLAQAKADRDRWSAVVQQNPNDQSARLDFQDAATRVGRYDNDLTTLQNAGPPATIYKQALPGSLTGANLLTVLAIALLSGLIAGAGVALVREQFDDRLRSPNDIKQAVPDAVLGEVAQIQRRQRKDRSLPVASPQATPFNESIRALRTSVLVLLPERNAIAVITSPEPGEGKTLIAANLALSLAQGGRSVILVDGDLRRPSLSEYFATPADLRGFAEAIKEDLDASQIDELLRPTVHPQLRLLPPGLGREGSADLLAGDALAAVCDRLRPLADIVLVDTPPARVFADASIISSHADATLVVASLHRTRLHSLSEAVQTLKASGAPLIGIVANRSRRTQASAYGHYGAPESGDVSSSPATSPATVDPAIEAAPSTDPVVRSDGRIREEPAMAEGSPVVDEPAAIASNAADEPTTVPSPAAPASPGAPTNPPR